MADQLDLYDAPAPLLYDTTATLTESLAALGYTHRRTATPGVREVVDTAGRVVTRGRADDVWKWLAAGRPEVRRG